MQNALYHPEKGYYTKNIKDVGARGDFSTSATLSQSLAKAIAKEIISYASEQEHDSRIDVIECGAGNGQLMVDIGAALELLLPKTLLKHIHFHIIEVSPTLQQKQKNLLQKNILFPLFRKKWQSRITWHHSINDALELCNGKAFIYHNEFVDAFPVRVFRLMENSVTNSPTNPTWHELYITKSDKFLTESWEQIDAITSSQILSEVRPSITTSLLENPSINEQSSISIDSSIQHIEIPCSYFDWLKELANCWDKGRMLTIDYGDTFPAVYHRRPQGTLRAYAMHQRLTGHEIYQNPGHQDITFDVNFTDLMHWGESLGFQHQSYLTQREFISQHLPDKGDHTLITEVEGAGDAFKVLIQHQES